MYSADISNTIEGQVATKDLEVATTAYEAIAADKVSYNFRKLLLNKYMAATVGLAAVVGVADHLASSAHRTNIALANQFETDLTQGERAGNIQADSEGYILRPGSYYYDSPRTVDSRFLGRFQGNRHEVGEGKTLLISTPAERKIDDETWFSFQQANCDIKLTRGFATAQAIGACTYWLPSFELIQVDSGNHHLIEKADLDNGLSDESIIDVHYNNRGNITTEEDDRPLAVADELDINTVDKLVKNGFIHINR